MGTAMRFQKLGLLILSLLTVGWGIPTTARAADQSSGDVQQSHYSVTLTPPTTPTITTPSGSVSGGHDGDLVSGGGADDGNPGTTSKPVNTSASGGQGATASPATGSSPTNQTSKGRLPQTSEAWFGLGTMAGIILLLTVWIGFLTSRRKKTKS